jgi:hypothetical protein
VNTAFTFDIDKTVAAAAYVAKRKGGTISTFILLKTLYAAERRALIHWYRPITGDTFCSLKKGVILSRTYNLIKREVMSSNSDMAKWAEHFSPRQFGYDINLLKEPDFDHLSDREKEALDQAISEIDSLVEKHKLIADVLHEKWPEWKNPEKFGRKMVPVDLEDIISQSVEDEDEVERICDEIRSVQAAKAALQVAA